MTLVAGSFLTSFLLVALTAGGYAVATAGIKMTSMYGLTMQTAAIMAVGFVVAALAQVILLRGANLAMIYVAIVATQTIFILLLASLLGDHVTFHHILGGVFVLAGVVMVSQ